MSYEQIVHSGDTEKWLAERRKSIGASDAPAILGLVSWGSPTSVQADKWGLLPEADASAREELAWGKAFEGAILNRFEADCEQVSHVGDFGWLIRDPDRPWLHATPDGCGLLTVEYDIGFKPFAEAKNSTADWSEGPPEAVHAQCQATLAVSGHPFMYTAACLFGRKLVWARVDRDEDWIAKWLELAEKFWDATSRREPIVDDGSYATHQALNLMYPGGGDLPYVAVGAEWIEIDELREQAKRDEADAEKRRKGIDARIKETAGDGPGIILPNGTTLRVCRETVKAHQRKESTRTVIRRKER